MSLQWLLDGEPGRALPPDDRALAYGDGVFETIRVHQGDAVWLQAHLERLQRGCVALGIEPPHEAVLVDEVMRLAGPVRAGVVKLVVTRGGGARGYRPDEAAVPRRITSAHPLPSTAPASLRTDHARLRLSVQPVLAGHKHLNRLEQVLAARECAQRGLDELLLADHDGRLVGGIAANLFWWHDGHWHTPAVDRAGVAGVCRGWILAQRPSTRIVHAGPDELAQAQELFLCNSVRGILPAGHPGGDAPAAGEHTRALMAELHAHSAAFPEPEPGTQ